MPRRTDISSILIIGAGCPPSPPSGGEGRGEGGVGDGSGARRTPPSPYRRFAPAFPLPLKGARGGFGILAQGHQDCSDHAIEIAHDLAVGEAQDAVAAGFQRGGARGVIGFAPGVAVAVELDDEARATGREVGDVRGKDDLALELDAETVSPKHGPQCAFGRSEVLPQLFGSGTRFWIPLHPSDSPLSPTPLPLKGARGLEGAK